MKRFFNFLVFVALLCIVVGALQLWKERRQGSAGQLTRRLHSLFNPETTHRHPETYTLADGPRVDLQDVNVLAAMSRQRIALARAVVPSVVSITTSRTVQVPDYQNDPFFQFFHRNQQRQNNRRTQNQLGSGAIVSQEGHIVTNNHVIEGMDEIEVKLSDERTYVARVVGTDPDTDIAVLKIDADHLVPLPFGNSEAVEVGETVMAVGNPYGLEESVTQGIISAKNRPDSENVGVLFQIDAAINPGNSGGPLVNVRGELIGVNEAIFSRSGGWQGVGFAIPSSTVRHTMDGILQLGRVVHGYLGIEPAPTQGPGVLVNRVVPDSPAARAAIRSGDTIRKLNGRTVRDFDDLRRSVAEVEVDATVPVEIVRDGKGLSVQARIAERPPAQAQLSQVPHLPPGHPPVGPQTPHGSYLPPDLGGVLSAVQVREISSEDLRTLDLPVGTHGVTVTRVGTDSGATGKLAPGDIIEAINQKPVNGLADYAKLTRGLPANEPVVVSTIRDRAHTMLVITPE